MAQLEGLKFGTSGLRGLVAELVGWPAYAYALAFARALLADGTVAPGRLLLVGRDLRASSAGIAARAMTAAAHAGLRPVDCGALPTPALALAALARGVPAIMVTGSHIPEDRNGLKFYRPDGEISKADEAAILAAFAAIDPQADAMGAAPAPATLDAVTPYLARYADFFGPDALSGLAIGVYQHSTVARDLLVDILGRLGAKTLPLGRAESFIPVDTEALRPEDVALAGQWAKAHRLDAIVSADGDADRPLVADATGAFLRGDILGLLTARHLGLKTIVTPVTSNSAIEHSGIAGRVMRTRVGSPFVIAGMQEAARAGAQGIVGFEANGGVLLGSAVSRDGRTLPALPTRDALLPILSLLAEVRRSGRPVAALVADLGAGIAAAHRLKDIAPDRSAAFLARLADDPAFANAFFAPVGIPAGIDRTDGVRVTLKSGAIVHFRASGNAPELRCYVEAPDAGRAQALLDWGLAAAQEALS